MKNSENKVLKQYLKEVDDALVCKKSIKRFYMKEIKQILDSYLEEKHDFTVEDLYRELGKPEKFANELTERDEYLALLKQAKWKNRLLICIGVSFIALFAASVIFIIEMMDIYGGTITVTGTVFPKIQFFKGI